MEINFGQITLDEGDYQDLEWARQMEETIDAMTDDEFRETFGHGRNDNPTYVTEGNTIRIVREE